MLRNPCPQFHYTALLFGLLALTSSTGLAAPKCLFVSSYHPGDAWSDGIERGLRRTLNGKCEIRQFDMQTKSRHDLEQIKKAVDAARLVIDEWRPDIVITADDPAARYLIAPYFRDATLPFVFCGVNWSADEYGFPYRNVTGMIETPPVRAMVAEAKALTPGASRILYIGANTSTERENAARVRIAAERQDLAFDQQFAASQASWIDAYRRAQTFDFVVIGSNRGIDDWNWQTASDAIEPLARRLSVTSHKSMMPVSMIGMTQVAEEQGEWAGKVALQVLDGTAPSDIPIVANRKWDLYLNKSLIDLAGVTLPAPLLRKGKIYQ